MPDRSRSPSGWSDWISRSVVSFARYERKRPAGLPVDDSGAFRLSSLMEAWGDSQGVTAKQVLQAIRDNLYSKSGTQRFELVDLPGGDHLVRACDRRGGGSWQKPSQEERSWGSDDKTWSGKSSSKSWESDKWGSDSGAWQKQSWNKKDGDAWEKPGKSWDSDGGKASWDAKEKKASWDAKENKSSWDAKDSKGWNSWKQRDWQRGGDSAGHGAGTPNPETVQRWIGFALKSGSDDLGVSVEKGGWASVEDIAAAMAEHKPEFGISDANGVQDLLRRTDTAGRFEVSGGRVRKLPRDQRHARSSDAVAGVAWPHEAPTASKDPPPHLSIAVQTKEEQQEAPPPPPGPHWTEYIDREVFWWYYEGPLGKWWMSQSDPAPIPWTDG